MSVVEAESTPTDLDRSDEMHSAMRTAVLVVSSAAIVVGLVVRLWVALGPLGVLNADEVIMGLMARDLLDGNLTAFFWGQAYGGTIEVLPLAAAIGVLGDDAGIVVLPFVEVVVIGLLLYAVARRHLDSVFALAVVGLYSIAPATSVWFSTRPMLFYGPVVMLGIGAILLAEQLNDPDRSSRDRLVRLGTIGVLLGVGWWTSAQILFLAVPVAYSLIRRRTVRSVAEFGALAGGAAFGASVWLVYNTRNRMQSMWELPATDGSVVDHVRAQVERGWPMVVGARRPFDERWLIPGAGWVLLPLALGTAVAVGVVFWRHRSLRTPLAAVLLAFPVLHALAPTGSFVGNGRYYYFVAPPLAFAVVAAISRLRACWREGVVIVVIVGSTIATTVTLASMRDLQFGPEDGDDLAAALRDREISDVYTNYWIGYPLAWFDDELRVTTDHTDRRPDWSAQVRDAPRAAYVFWLPYVEDARRYERLEPLLRDIGIEESFDVGGYRVVIPTRNVPPERLGATEPNR